MPELIEFRVTFGVMYAHEEHPTFPPAHPDGWVTVLAEDEPAARALVVERIGRAWAFIYPPGRLNEHYHPLGELDRWTVADVEVPF